MAAGERPILPTPTVTLGKLYLAQGHRREAAEIFERILRADPGNRRAREGLESLRARKRGLVAGEEVESSRTGI